MGKKTRRTWGLHFFAVLGMDPTDLRMLGKHSAPELRLSPKAFLGERKRYMLFQLYKAFGSVRLDAQRPVSFRAGI